MLETTIDAEPRDGSVRFAVRVENRGDEDVELSFSDSQRVRVTVYPAGEDDPRWRSDDGQMFMQVIGSETLPAGGETVFGTVWEDADPGEYRVVAEVVCEEKELQAETTFAFSS